ncbi:MAG: hypothetical protein AB7D37_06065 [Desulfovibrio sp.]
MSVSGRDPLPGVLPYAPGDRVGMPQRWRSGRCATWIMAIVWTGEEWAARCAGERKPVPLALIERRGGGK